MSSRPSFSIWYCIRLIRLRNLLNHVINQRNKYIIIGADGDDIDTGITVDTSAGHKDPIYRGPNAQGLVVAAVDGTSLTIQNADGSVFDASSIDASNTFYFLDEFHGVGGTTTEGVKFPKGITIYGRWTTVTPEADADGGVICYFGK